MQKQFQTTPILTNVYRIPERLREIDSNYFVVRNHEKKTFEVHHSGQAGTTYCLTVPYPELDARTLDLVQKTRISNLDTLISEMDQNNRRLEEKNREIPEEACVKTKEVLSYLNHHESKDTVDRDAYSTRFI
ncbi:MAG: hypothetical protein J6A61_06755 [Clostridia bacterium]|nr:hypothetical protein [Clostridia bacterium]